MNVASTSTATLRCCSRSTRPLLQLANKSTRSAQSKGRPERPPGPSRTEPGTNKKPDAAGRPNRYTTRYGIPPLHESLTTADPAKKLSRQAYERAQRPDFERIWKLEDDMATAVSEEAREEVRKKLLDIRANQPKRHPLWAFFREKTREDVEDEERYLSTVVKQNYKVGKSVIDNENATAVESWPGAFSLAISMQKPDAKSGTSGRSWAAEELRRKSFEDLHTLWYKIVIERNALYTQKEETRRSGIDFASYTYIQEQLHRCRKTMARIKYILHERRLAVQDAQQILRDDRSAGQAKARGSQSTMLEPDEAGVNPPPVAPAADVHAHQAKPAGSAAAAASFVDAQPQPAAQAIAP